MNTTPPKYNWQRDAAIVFVVAVLVFYLDPIGRVYEAGDYSKESDLFWLWQLIIIAGVTITVMLISLRHYWKWVIVSTFCVGTANQLTDYFFRYAGYQDNIPIWHIIFNNWFFLAVVLPVAALVRFSRKKRKK